MGLEIFICILLIAVGIVLIVKGGDWFVDAASWIAKVSGVPTFIIGATIVSVATTLPEVIVSTMAAAEGSVDMAIGNAVGSVNCNVALIMAISLIFMPAKFKRKDYAAKIFILFIAIALLWGLSANGELNMYLSLIVLALFFLFLLENVLSAKKRTKTVPDLGDTIKVDEYNYVSYDANFKLNPDGTVTGKKVREKPSKKEIIKNVILFALGTAGIVGGAQLLVNYGSELARIIHIPESVISVTIIAVGTSLPELVTTITAIIKKKSELSVGNIIGANIIDVALILPLCSMIAGGNLAVNAQTLTIDFPFCIAAVGVALIPALIKGKFMRWQGVLLLCGYVAYIGVLTAMMI